MSSLDTICREAAARAIHWKPMAALAAIAVAFLAISPLARVPARLVAACGEWIALAAGLELLSMLGFIAVFALVFAPRRGARHQPGAGLRALAAITVLPAGALVRPAMAARTSRAGTAPLPVLTRSTIALTILTTAPSLLVLGGLGFTLWLGWLPGPHGALLTLPAGAVALAVLAGVWLIGRSVQTRGRDKDAPGRGRRRHLVAAAGWQCRDGAAEACRLMATGNWKLAGAIGYYAFDNAVLWAAFHAYGRTPAVSVIAMGYLRPAYRRLQRARSIQAAAPRPAPASFEVTVVARRSPAAPQGVRAQRQSGWTKPRFRSGSQPRRPRANFRRRQ